MATLAPPRREHLDFGRGQPPTTDINDDGSGGRGWVELVCAPNDIEAHLVTGRLAEAGIETNTVVDRGIPGAFLYGGHNPWAPVSILVRQMDLVEARIVLAEVAFGAPSSDPPRRPPDERERRKRTALWWVVAVALGLLFTGLGFIGSIERCERIGVCEPSSP